MEEEEDNLASDFCLSADDLTGVVFPERAFNACCEVRCLSFDAFGVESALAFFGEVVWADPFVLDF